MTELKRKSQDMAKNHRLVSILDTMESIGHSWILSPDIAVFNFFLLKSSLQSRKFYRWKPSNWEFISVCNSFPWHPLKSYFSRTLSLSLSLSLSHRLTKGKSLINLKALIYTTFSEEEKGKNLAALARSLTCLSHFSSSPFFDWLAGNNAKVPQGYDWEWRERETSVSRHTRTDSVYDTRTCSHLWKENEKH